MNPSSTSSFLQLYLFPFAALLITGVSALCDTYTTLVSSTWNLGTHSVSFDVKSNEVAKVVSGRAYGNVAGKGGGSALTLIKGPVQTEVSSSTFAELNIASFPMVTGPAKFILTSQGVTETGLPPTTNSAIVTIQTFPSMSGEGVTPFSSVVIPADAGGPVSVILESSVDLVTWTAALPGTYATSTQKRFFRVRAER